MQREIKNRIVTSSGHVLKKQQTAKGKRSIESIDAFGPRPRPNPLPLEIELHVSPLRKIIETTETSLQQGPPDKRDIERIQKAIDTFPTLDGLAERWESPRQRLHGPCRHKNQLKTTIERHRGDGRFIRR